MESNTSEQDVNRLKWYNDKSKFWWSLLLWPIFLYGLYKTNLVSKKIKNLIFGAVVLLIIWGKNIPISNNDAGELRQSSWDNSVECVETYLKHNYLRDPDSYQSVHWDKASKNADGTYSVSHTFRARNGFGGMNEETLTFRIAKDGQTVIGYY